MTQHSRRDRLQAALPRLDERLKELKASEEDARRWAAYKKLEVERDAIVEELKEYPALAKRIAAIVERLAANDAAVDRLNNYALPSRAPKLRSAELIARDLSSFSPAQFVTIPRIGAGDAAGSVRARQGRSLSVAAARSARRPRDVQLPEGRRRRPRSRIRGANTPIQPTAAQASMKETPCATTSKSA